MLKSLKAVVLGGSVLAGVLGVAQSANALPVKVEEVVLYRGGTLTDWLNDQNIIFDDSMNNGNPLTGPLFSNGSASNYTYHNLQNPADFNKAFIETNGLLINADYATVSQNAANTGLGRGLGLRLQTNTSDPVRGLNQNTSFAAAAAFAYQAPAAGYGYGVRLTDSFSNGSDIVDLRIYNSGAGSFIYFRHQDFLAATITDYASRTPIVPDGASVIALFLAREDANTDVIKGYYGFANVNGDLLGSVVDIGQTTIFHGEVHTQFELRALAPVPEPESYAMLLAGLGLMGVVARRKKNWQS